MEEERKRVTLRYLQAKFRQYYRTEPLRLPPRFGRREFGFIPFEGGYVLRHRGFPSEKALYRFVQRECPAHMYHSAAYYERPDAPTMAEKGWKGADLIFDLDADHIPGWQKLGYKGMLEAVKDQVIRLIDEFLVGDLGFAEGDLDIAFSGGRGYHIHIRDPRVLGLESHERREIVDYITGTGLDLDRIAREEVIKDRVFQGRSRPVKRIRLPEVDVPGWEGRATRGIVDWLRDVASLPEEDALETLEEVEGVGPSRARTMYDTLRRIGPERALDRVRKGLLEIFPPGVGIGSLRSTIVGRGVDLAKGATDEPVTSDIKRLIRIVGSLHGKSGLAVVPLTRDELDAFDPLVDAVPDLYLHERVGVRLATGIKTDMMDERFNLPPGQNSVPEYLAIHLMCRGVAVLAAGTEDDAIRKST